MKDGLFSTLFVEPASTIRQALRFEREHGAALRRGALLRELGDSLVVLRPRSWTERSRRAYAGAARVLSRIPVATSIPAGDPALVAHAMLREARNPIRRGEIAALKLASSVAILLFAVFGLLVLAVPPLRSWVAPLDVAQNANWTASSALGGYPTSGVGPSSTGNMFFHTMKEDRPWLLVELPREARVRTIRIENRADCCGERALPLNVEVRDASGFALACQRRAPFSTWTCRLPGTPIKSFRVTVPGSTFLHLKRVAAFE